MSTATFIDTETTDVGDDRQVIELAHLGPLAVFQWDQRNIHTQRYRPTKPISLGALAAHHILDEDLIDQPRWPGRFEISTDYLIGHNVDFDWASIGKPPVKRICTLALARKYWPQLDSHSLTAMTYYFAKSREKARTLLRNVHSAEVDVLLLATMLEHMLDARVFDAADWDELWRVSEHARIPTRFTFGKYGPQGDQPGVPIAEVRRMDPSYIQWCIDKCDQCQDEYWQRALKGQA